MARTIFGAFQSQAGLGVPFCVCSRDPREIGERKSLSAALRNLRKREKCYRGSRATCANEKIIVGSLAQPARARKNIL